MKRIIWVVALILGVYSRSFADGPQKPPHYGDWDVIVDKVTKKTTLIHQHRPYGQPVPGMGDAFTSDTFQLEYSFEAIIQGVPGTKNYKINYYLLFDNPIQRNATLVLAVQNRFFKYTPETQFTLLTDDQNWTAPIENYHTGEFGDDLIGHHPFEEFRVALPQEILAKILAAKEVAGNLSSDDQNANKSFTFDQA
ncbi:MAG TPA: hypothetical protein VJ873_12755, partial [bacterium]|nr:hypothetical protein [bacterium]